MAAETSNASNGSAEVARSRAAYEAQRDRFVRNVDDRVLRDQLLAALDGAYSLGESAGSMSETSQALAAQARFLEEQEAERARIRKRDEDDAARHERQVRALEAIASCVKNGVLCMRDVDRGAVYAKHLGAKLRKKK